MDFEHQEIQEPLGKQVERAEQEARIVLPGIQALFGFQFIAVFNQPFFERLKDAEQKQHFCALIMTAISTLFMMSTAAYHRQVEPGKVSKRFVSLASKNICVSLFALAVGVFLDVDLIGRVILHHSPWADYIAVALLLTYLGLWFIGPQIVRQFKDHKDSFKHKSFSMPFR